MEGDHAVVVGFFRESPARIQMALRAFRLMFVLRPSAARHKFRDDAIIPGGIAARNPLRNRIQAMEKELEQ